MFDKKHRDTKQNKISYITILANNYKYSCFFRARREHGYLVGFFDELIRHDDFVAFVAQPVAIAQAYKILENQETVFVELVFRQDLKF